MSVLTGSRKLSKAEVDFSIKHLETIKATLNKIQAGKIGELSVSASLGPGIEFTIIPRFDVKVECLSTL